MCISQFWNYRKSLESSGPPFHITGSRQSIASVRRSLHFYLDVLDSEQHEFKVRVSLLHPEPLLSSDSGICQLRSFIHTRRPHREVGKGYFIRFSG